MYQHVYFHVSSTLFDINILIKITNKSIFYYRNSAKNSNKDKGIQPEGGNNTTNGIINNPKQDMDSKRKFGGNIDTTPENLYPYIPREIIKRDDAGIQKYANNSDLRKVFYGVDYSPLNVMYPSCGCSQRDVSLDVIILSQITDRIRLYGTDCRQAEYVLNAFIDLDLNMTMSLGVWYDLSYEGSTRQMEEMKKIVMRYPSKYIDSIIIGNEGLFRGDYTEDELISKINSIRDFLEDNNIDIPVGTSDIGSKWSKKLAENVDVLAANIHPFFGGVPVQLSTKW